MDNIDPNEKKEKNIQLIILIFGGICLLLIFAGFYFGFNGYQVFDMNLDKGMESFGNYASGTVVAFWSLAGVILIFIAFLGQKLELLYQKEELKLNRKELAETREEFKLQNKTLSKQNFENLFFQMLRNYTDIVHHIDIGSGDSRQSGRDCFYELYRLFKQRYGEFSQITDEKKRIELAYEKFFNDYQSDLGNYFKNLYHLFKYINNSTIDDKEMYINIMRAQLSTYELALFFYSCLSSYGKKKFKPLIERYNLVKNLPKNILIKSEHADLYTGVIYEEDERKQV